MEKIRIGVLGYGFMGHNHVRDLCKRQDVEVVAVCDTDTAKLSDVPAGIQVFDNMDAVIALPQVQVILIAVPNHLHLEAVRKAALAGKDIICEKPVALSVAELDEMERIVTECNVRFTVHQQRRFDGDYCTAKAVLESGTLGDVYTIQSGLYGINGNMHDWHVYRKYGGGMLYDWGVHLIDQMLMMVPGPIRTIFADVRNVINAEVDDYFKILICFENGITAEIELGTYFLEDRDKWFERHWFIGGSKGTMYSDGFDPEGKICRTTRLLTNVPGQTTMTAAGPTRSFGPPAPGVLTTEQLPVVKTAHEKFFDHYVQAYREKKEFEVTIPQVRRVLKVMEAARISAATRSSVTVESYERTEK